MATASGPAHRNEVLLVGTMTTDPAERTTSDDQQIVTFRLDVEREHAGTGHDEFDCSVSTGRGRRAALEWAAGDVVEVAGALRRRFYRGASGTRPFFVVEADQARRVGPTVRRRRTT
jgi:single-strand DNA-binding protein